MRDQLFLLSKAFDGQCFRDEPFTLRTRGAYIEDVADGHPDAPPSEVDVHDLRGEVLLPGLVNGHVHIARAGMFAPSEPVNLAAILSNLRTALASGTTTVGDMGCPHPLARELLGLVTRDVSMGPDLRVSGPILTSPKGYPFDWMPPLFRFFHTAVAIDGPDAAKRSVARLAERGVHHIKIAIMHRNYAEKSLASLDEPRAKAIVQEAHALGLKVYAHAHANDDYAVALAAGVDALAHSSFDPLTPELVDRIAGEGVAVCPTLWVFDSMCFGCEARLDLEPEMQKGASPALVREWAQFAEAYAASGDVLPAGIAGGLPKLRIAEATRIASANLRLLADRGVRLGFGNDANYGFSRVSQPLRELECMAKSGLDEEACLRSATSGGAKYLGLDDRGSLTRGMLADFVVLPRWDSLSSLSKPSRVMRRGEWVTPHQDGMELGAKLRLARGMLKSVVF